MTVAEQIDDSMKYGFELAIRYAELAVKFDLDPLSVMKEKLTNWNKESSEVKKSI